MARLPDRQPGNPPTPQSHSAALLSLLPGPRLSTSCFGFLPNFQTSLFFTFVHHTETMQTVEYCIEYSACDDALPMWPPWACASVTCVFVCACVCVCVCVHYQNDLGGHWRQRMTCPFFFFLLFLFFFFFFFFRARETLLDTLFRLSVVLDTM